MTDFQHISYEVAEGIATITLDRPEALNAFTDTMESELITAYDRADHDDEVRAVIITGAGRAFCAGMDLSDGSAAFDEWSSSGEAPEGARPEGTAPSSAEPRRDGGGRVVLRMYEFRKPIIAAINGPAVGVGLTMTLAADFRLAVPGNKLGFVFTRRGLVPESCSSWFLPRLVGMQTALEWMYSGRIFSSEEALDKGLLYGIHGIDDLLRESRALATALTSGVSRVSVALSRQMLWQMAGAPHPMIAHRVETHALNVMGVSEDAREGIAAFVDKREAEFPGLVSRDVPEVFGSYPPPAYESPTGLV